MQAIELNATYLIHLFELPFKYIYIALDFEFMDKISKCGHSNENTLEYDFHFQLFVS